MTVRSCGLKELRAVLVCTFTFDGGYFQQLLEALAEEDTSGADHLRAIPVDVVCDHIAARNTFGDAFREAAQRLCCDMRSWELRDEELSTILNGLERALEAAETVADIRAASRALEAGSSMSGSF